MTLLKKLFILKRLQNKVDVEIRASLKTSSHAFFYFLTRLIDKIKNNSIKDFLQFFMIIILIFLFIFMNSVKLSKFF